MSAPATHEELIASLDRIGDGVDALKKENADLRAALERCIALFSEIRGDWTDPRSECREGIAVARAALAKAAQ